MQRFTGLTMTAMAAMIALAGCGEKRTDNAAETTTGTTDMSGSATAADGMIAPSADTTGTPSGVGDTGAMTDSSGGMTSGGGAAGAGAAGAGTGGAMDPMTTESTGAMDKGSGGGAASGTGTSQQPAGSGTTPPS